MNGKGNGTPNAIAPFRNETMTRMTALLMLLTALAATGCYARAGYYAEPAYLATVYAAPTAVYARPYSYGYGYERPDVYITSRPVFVAPRPVYRAPAYSARFVARPAPHRAAPAVRGYRR